MKLLVGGRRRRRYYAISKSKGQGATLTQFQEFHLVPCIKGLGQRQEL